MIYNASTCKLGFRNCLPYSQLLDHKEKGHTDLAFQRISDFHKRFHNDNQGLWHILVRIQ